MLARLSELLPAGPGELPQRRALLEAVAGLQVTEGDPGAAVAGLAAAGLLGQSVAQHGSLSIRSLCVVRAALAYRSPLYDLMFVM